MKHNIRISLLLAVVLLATALCAAFPVMAESTDDHLVFHYDFQGSTDAERLSNKVSGSDTGNLTVTSPGKLSYVKDGYAYINTAKGEYISAALGNDVKRMNGAATFFFVFMAEGDKPSSVGDIAQIGGTVRVAVGQNNLLFTRIGSKFASDAATQKNIPTAIMRNAWVWVAVTLDYDANGNVSEQFLLSQDEGKTWTSNQFSLTGVEGMLATANDLLLGKVSRGIDDRGTSFYYRDLRLYDKVLTVDELKSITVPTVVVDTPVVVPTPDPSEDPDPNRNIGDHLVVHYDFLGATTEEKLQDKAPAGKSREDLMMYSSITDGQKDSYLEKGTVYISSKQANFLFAIPGEDITGLKKSMTAFVVFQPTGENPNNPGDFFTLDNNVRFGFHHTSNALFSGVGTSFGGGGTSGKTLERGKWIHAAITLIWDSETGKVSQTISYSVDGGKNYTSVSRVVSNIEVMYSNVTYLILGKIAPGMADRGTNFRYQDVRVYDCALTLDELKSIQVAEYDPSTEQPQPPVVDPGKDNPTGDQPGKDDPAGNQPGNEEKPSGNVTEEPPVTETPSETETDAPDGDGKTGCASSSGIGAMLLLLLLAASAVCLSKRRHHVS